MKVKKYQNDEERAILTALIVHNQFLAKVVSHTKGEKAPFRSKWSNLIFKWCRLFYEKYQKAPRKSIISLFNQFAEKVHDEDTIEIVEKFLSGLSDDYKGLARELNESFLLDVAGRYFNNVKLEHHTQIIEQMRELGDVEGAKQVASSFTEVNLATTSMVDVFTDTEAMADAIRPAEEDVLVQYGGALGEFFGPHLQRDGFIAFLASEKRGKSWFLMDVAWHAAVGAKRRTLLYSVGDMTQPQMMRRLMARAAKRPIEAAEIRVPRSLVMGSDREPKIKYRTKNFEDRISQKEAKRAMKAIQIKTAHSSSLLRMRCTSNSSTKVMDIQADIEDLVRSGWVPDVLVVDYADILAPEKSLGEDGYRHQIDETWKALRRLSQIYHMLVVTATQANAASYQADVVRRYHFSEDKRKFSHVTGMVGINQTDSEKKRGIYRLNWVLLREGFYTESRCVTTAGCLALSNPAMHSTW